MKALKSLFWKLLAGLGLVCGAVLALQWLSQPKQWEMDAATARAQAIAEYQARPVAAWKPGPKHAEFIKIIRDVYDVESAAFVRDDYLQLIFAPAMDEDEQGTCQAIANLWYSKQLLPEIRVDCWHGQERTAQASVINGNMITPPPPKGRRAKRKAE